MGIPLYDLSVRCFVQTVGAVASYLDKAAAHFKETGVDPEDVVEQRLIADMNPFRFQIHSIAHHSIGAIEAVKAGAAGPPPPIPALTYAELRKRIADAHAGLEKLTPAEINAYEGKDVIFRYREHVMPFTAEGYLLSFSLPNFHFHATTAYDILRMKGVPLGKGDYLGRVHLKS